MCDDAVGDRSRRAAHALVDGGQVDRDVGALLTGPSVGTHGQPHELALVLDRSAPQPTPRRP